MPVAQLLPIVEPHLSAPSKCFNSTVYSSIDFGGLELGGLFRRLQLGRVTLTVMMSLQLSRSAPPSQCIHR